MEHVTELLAVSMPVVSTVESLIKAMLFPNAERQRWAKELLLR